MKWNWSYTHRQAAIALGMIALSLLVALTLRTEKYFDIKAERDTLKQNMIDLYETYAFCDSLDRALWFYMEDWKEPTMYVCTLSVTNDRLIKRDIGVHSIYILNRLRKK